MKKFENYKSCKAILNDVLKDIEAYKEENPEVKTMLENPYVRDLKLMRSIVDETEFLNRHGITAPKHKDLLLRIELKELEVGSMVEAYYYNKRTGERYMGIPVFYIIKLPNEEDNSIMRMPPEEEVINWLRDLGVYNETHGISTEILEDLYKATKLSIKESSKLELFKAFMLKRKENRAFKELIESAKLPDLDHVGVASVRNLKDIFNDWMERFQNEDSLVWPGDWHDSDYDASDFDVLTMTWGNRFFRRYKIGDPEKEWAMRIGTLEFECLPNHGKNESRLSLYYKTDKEKHLIAYVRLDKRNMELIEGFYVSPYETERDILREVILPMHYAKLLANYNLLCDAMNVSSLKESDLRLLRIIYWANSIIGEPEILERLRELCPDLLRRMLYGRF